MAIKFRDAGPKAAYEIAVGVTAEEAAEAGLAVVEVDPTSGAPTAYGRYKDAPDGGPLGITVGAAAADTQVIAGGDVGAPAPDTGVGGKGNLVNPDDPVIHGGSDDIHRDGAEPPVEDLAARARDEAEVARQSIEDASKALRKTSKGK
jgi:hypothetical protein